MSKCLTEKCNKTRAPKNKYCHSCIKRKYAEKHPMRYCYNNLKQNSKRRGKSFNLTFEDFKQFCIETEYMQNKGKKKKSYHIDRIDETKGYTKDNIQVLTNTQNVRKYVEWVNRDEFGNLTFTTRNNLLKVNIENEDDCPF